MKNKLKRTILTSIITIVGCNAVADPPSSIRDWELIFNDEFDGNELDKSKWNPTYSWGHTHNHRAYCVEENVLVENGLLRIKGEAKRHPDAPATCSNGGKTYSLDYTSGAIDTHGKFNVKYGYIEGRFKMPSQLGTWPAFWMLQDGWPPEIDIFEVPHNRTENHYYLHYTNTSWYAQHGSAWDHEASFGGVHKGPDKSADFHNYGLGWSDGNISFYFDDKLVASYNRPTELSQLTAMYIIINLAIGGWATDNGNPIQVTEGNPAYLECDWIRVWKPKKLDLNTEEIRLLSVEENKCMVADGNTLTLGDCSQNNAIATIADVGNGTYRVNFSDKVLEIPNEAKTNNAKVGLWEWNGKAHQKLYIRQEEEDKSIITLNFTHSGYYVQTNGGNIIQSTEPSDQSSLWRILQKEETASNDYEASIAKSTFISEGKKIRIIPCERFSMAKELSISIYSLDGTLLSRESVANENEIYINNPCIGSPFIIKLEGDNFTEVTKKL